MDSFVPTNAAKESNHETLQEFFDLELSKKIVSKNGKPDIITFTNVFAHIEDLPELLKVIDNPHNAKELSTKMLIIRATAFLFMAYGLGKKHPVEIRILLLAIWMAIYNFILLYYKLVN